jgi:acyl dehydratase
MERSTQQPEVRRGESISENHTFGAEDIADFARRSGDSNPVHLDVSAGRASRFGKRIASAQHTISLMIGLAGSWLARRGRSVSLGCSFRFTAAVMEGDVVELRWTVTETVAKETLKGLIVVLDGTATNAAGRVCVMGTLEMLLLEPADA